MKPKHLIISLDFDGCADRDYSRKEIALYIEKACAKNPSIESIYVIIGSLRQSVYLDLLNAHRNSNATKLISCTSLYHQLIPIIHELISKMDRQQVPKIHFCPLLMNDIHNHLPTGTTFKAMTDIFSWTKTELSKIPKRTAEYWVTNQHGERINILSDDDNKEIADCSKVTLIYTQLHYFAQHLDNAPLLMQFFDDREDILSGLNEFYQANHELMPENTQLELILNKAQLRYKPNQFNQTDIIGKGPVNTHYHELMYQLALYYNWTTIPNYLSITRQLFNDLLSMPLSRTHIQTFEVYPVPIQKIQTPGASTQAKNSSDNPSAPLKYDDIQVPDVLPDNMSIFGFYQKIISEINSVYQRKIQQASNLYNNNLELFINLNVYSEVFDLAYRIEANKRQLDTSNNIHDMQIFFENFIADYEDEYGLEKDCLAYANLRCDFEEEKMALQHAHDKAKDTKIKLLANHLNLSSKEFIERMERQNQLVLYKSTGPLPPIARKGSETFSLNENQQTNTPALRR
jgi:hypothetical protein